MSTEMLSSMLLSLQTQLEVKRVCRWCLERRRPESNRRIAVLQLSRWCAADLRVLRSIRPACSYRRFENISYDYFARICGMSCPRTCPTPIGLFRAHGMSVLRLQPNAPTAVPYSLLARQRFTQSSA